MNYRKWPVAVLLGLSTISLMLAACSPKLEAAAHSIVDSVRSTNAVNAIDVESLAPVPFDEVIIDDNNAGDVKLVGDMDGDGFADLIIGGMPGENLNWYRYPDWQKTVIATPAIEFTTDGALGDVDGDGVLDIVVPDGDAGENLLWFENPYPESDPLDGAQWSQHTIGAIGSWGKDVELADFDNNGLLDVATRDSGSAMIFFQTAPNAWQRESLTVANLGYEGMASGDLNDDSQVDLIFRGSWLQNPGGASATDPSLWNESLIGDAPDNFKALVADLNGDGQNDVVFSSSEDTADVQWWTPKDSDPSGEWQAKTIVSSLEKGHTLQAADMDLDGDMDVVLGQMHTSSDGQLMIFANSDGQATTWERQIVGDGGLHNGVLADIGSDGDMDIFGANWTGNPPVRLWVNQLDQAGPVDRWTYKQITGDHAQAFGLAFGDVNGDGMDDIISGQYWYANPGHGMLADWQQNGFPDEMQTLLFTDVDSDGQPDVIAVKDEGLTGVYWLEAVDKSWNVVKIGSVDSASHSLGPQGYVAARLEGGQQPSILLSSGNGIFLFSMPQDPATGDWPRVHVSANPSDEGLAIGDIDGDGLADVAATTGDSKRVEWYRNPGDGSDDWPPSVIGAVDSWVYPDRIALADLNEDGRLDAITTEENGADAGAQSIWWEQPADDNTSEWIQHPITTQATTNSLDVGDLDGDGVADVILAEHRGERKLAVWLNDGDGNLVEHVIDSGRESHLGGRLYDLDGDGDLDIISIAWDEFPIIHLWRNDNVLTSVALANLPVIVKTEPNSAMLAEPATRMHCEGHVER